MTTAERATYTSHSSAIKSDCFMEAIAVAHIDRDGATNLLWSHPASGDGLPS